MTIILDFTFLISPTNHRNLQDSILDGANIAAQASFVTTSGGGVQQDDEISALIELGSLVAANKWAQQQGLFHLVPQIDIGRLSGFINSIPSDRFGPIRFYATALRDGFGLRQRNQNDPKKFLTELRVSSLGLLLAQVIDMDGSCH